MEASLSKFAKCLFIPVRWGRGEAINVKNSPHSGPGGALLWGDQMELQPPTLDGLGLAEKGAQEAPAPPVLPLRPQRGL